MTVSSEALDASPASGSSERPQFGQKREPRRIGAPQSQRGARPREWSRSSISARRASMPTIARCALGEQVVAEAAAPVHLDEQAAEVAQRVVACLAERAALAAEHPGVGAARGDAFRRGGTPAKARRHAAQSTYGGGEDVRPRVANAPTSRMIADHDRDDSEDADARHEEQGEADDDQQDSEPERTEHGEACDRLSGLQNNESLFGHLADRPGGAFARVAGRLDAPVGHLVGAEGRRLVDDHAAELEPARRVEASAEVVA